MNMEEFIALYNPTIMLEEHQRKWLKYLDFEHLERRVLCTPYRLGGLTDLVIGVDFASPENRYDLTSVCIARKIWYDGDKVHTVIIDDIYTEPVKKRDASWHALDKFFNEPYPIQEEPEPMAGTHKASPRTRETKKPLPFYQGKRRF